jgi:hypothetical protein
MVGNSGDRHELSKSMRGRVQMVKVIAILSLGEHAKLEKDQK